MTSPVVTKLTVAGSGMSAVMTAVYTHFNNGGSGSTHWRIDSGSTVNGSGADGFTIEPKSDALGSSWQINFRRTSTTNTKLLIDPNGTVTNSGNTGASPTGASTMASAEGDHFKSQSGTNVIYVFEWSDSIILLTYDSGVTFYDYGVAIGRIMTPLFSGGSEGGFGILSTTPSAGNAASTDWLHSSGASRIRVAATGSAATDWVTCQSTRDSLSASAQSVGGQSKPVPIVVTMGTATDRDLGVLKHIFASYPARSNNVRLQDSGGVERYIHVCKSSSNSTLVIRWPDNTTP